MPYKIAITSSNGVDIDLHFGHTHRFYILQVHEASGAWEVLEQRILPPPPCPAGGAGSICGGCGGGLEEGRLQGLIEILSDCAYLLTARIGPKPQAALNRAGLTVLESPPDISYAVQRLNAYPGGPRRPRSPRRGFPRE